ncbi:MAG: peptide deformylase [Clostridia bacterium]|nr:peptide deformylase [Clostridia bacterium]
MAIRELRFKGDEILTKKARYVDEIDEKIKILAEDMLDTMYANDGVGLAACQVGMLKSMITYDVMYVDEKHPRKEPIVMINPKITSRSKSMVLVEEGCLSFPKIFENVKRHEKITVEYTDLNGKKQVKTVKGMESVVIQHETDHLDGIVFLDRKEK